MEHYSHLMSGCAAKFPFCSGDCGDDVKKNEKTGRWYITMGHPGFNSTANNGNGYSTEAKARSELKRYARA